MKGCWILEDAVVNGVLYGISRNVGTTVLSLRLPLSSGTSIVDLFPSRLKVVKLHKTRVVFPIEAGEY